ncbi:DUF1853 family protein [Flavobacterium faecale]|uniref:DUF1853 family protein n=1 Tax=Flavobacterium faecale TaxID=1355330 RepID=UPI003AADBDA2
MQTNSRIASIINANSLDFSVTGIPAFDLSVLELPDKLHVELPTNLRLGHLVEKIISELIKASSNYNIVYENLQIIEDKKTIGEIDFIIQNEITKQLTHLELAYKFYLYDPTLSAEPINNWIGPNRNDSLQEKLEKLKTKQFPLLYHDSTQSTLDTIAIDTVSNALCLLISLFIPYEYKANFDPSFQKAIKGYYINFETFISHHSKGNTYYLPQKKEWGIDPSDNEIWLEFENIEKKLSLNICEKQSSLCWQKNKDSYLAFFIVWW